MSYCKGSKAHRHSSFHRYVCALGLICWQVTSVLSAFSDSAKHCNLIAILVRPLISNASKNFAATFFSNLVIMEIASSWLFPRKFANFWKKFNARHWLLQKGKNDSNWMIIGWLNFSRGKSHSQHATLLSVWTFYHSYFFLPNQEHFGSEPWNAICPPVMNFWGCCLCLFGKSRRRQHRTNN